MYSIQWKASTRNYGESLTFYLPVCSGIARDASGRPRGDRRAPRAPPHGPPRGRRLRSRRLSANFPLVPVENPGRALIAALTVSLTVTVAAPSARAEIFGNTYRSADFGVEITVPRGFELSEQRAYPGL